MRPQPPPLTRRDFLRGAAAVAAGASVSPALSAIGAAPTARSADAADGARSTAGIGGSGRPRTAIIIGSGFDGCVAALRLGRAGYRTTVLERGRRWNTDGGPDEFPRLMDPDKRVAWFADHPSINQTTRIVPIERYPGLIDRVHGEGADAVFGAGVGGGSLTFGTFSIQPRRREWELIYPAEIDYDEMDSTWFPLARKEMGVSPLPGDLLAMPQWKGARAWLDTVADAGLETTRHHFAIEWDRVREELDGRRTPSVSIGEYVYGTNSGAKLSLDRTYLARAEATGNVTVEPMTEAIDVGELPDGRMEVTSKLIDDAGREIRRRTDAADVVVMAAGAFHSTALLARMRASGRLPRLSTMVGRNVGTNGDFLVGQTLQRRDFGAKQGGPGVGVVFDEGPAGPYSLAWEGAPFPDFAGGFTTTHLMQVMTDQRGSIPPTPPRAPRRCRTRTLARTPTSTVRPGSRRCTSSTWPTTGTVSPAPACRCGRRLPTSAPRARGISSAGWSWTAPAPTVGPPAWPMPADASTATPGSSSSTAPCSPEAREWSTPH